MPSFNIDGKTKISTSVGLAATTFICLVLTGFAVSRTIVLINGDRPQIQTYEEHDHFKLTEPVDLKKLHFQIAFSVEGMD
jgi:hypothetical protein